MKIYFEGKTNSDIPYINGAYFRLKSGREIFVDRNSTEFTVEDDGNITMTWKGCYEWVEEWTGEYTEVLLTEEMLKDASFIGLEIEDDAPEEYFFTINGVIWDEPVPEDDRLDDFLAFVSNTKVIKVESKAEYDRFYNLLNTHGMVKYLTRIGDWNKLLELGQINNRMNPRLFLFEFKYEKGLTWSDDLEKAVEWYGYDPITF